MNGTDLEKQGWTRQATYDEPRLGEMVAFYKEIGYEVVTIPFRPTDAETCDECMRRFPERYQTIFTRKLTEKNRGDI
jgi:hypothetical protein